MAKISSIFLCSKCDAQSLKWAGRCAECGAWGTLTETAQEERQKNTPTLGSSATIPFSDIRQLNVPRMHTGIGELDQVLGGGIVPGSFILIGGEPGIGKSTLLLQIAITLAKDANHPVLYCSGEESAEQIKLRFDRLFDKKNTAAPSALTFLGEVNCERICATIAAQKPILAIVDSIQTLSSNLIDSEAGSIAQVRACTVRLLEVAKQHGVPIIITGHVTKEGMVAGPKTLEHLVDTVLYLEGDADHYFRLLKTVKNRFGSTNELGVFEMTDKGLCEVKNPSCAFLSDTNNTNAGTVTSVVLEGSRAFLVQVQALTSKTYFGYPQRRAVGFDSNRLQLLIAVLTKRLGLNLGDQDIHLNIAGGFKVGETAIDLAVAASIISAYKNTPLQSGSIVIGEVGLNGEIRPVSHIEKRLKEAEKLGFTHAFLPPVKVSNLSLKLSMCKNLKDLEM